MRTSTKHLLVLVVLPQGIDLLDESWEVPFVLVEDVRDVAFHFIRFSKFQIKDCDNYAILDLAIINFNPTYEL